MTLAEIFKDNPTVQDMPEVQKLIAYAQEQHARSWRINQRLEKQNFAILDLCMHSEVMLINGTTARETLEKILTLYND